MISTNFISEQQEELNYKLAEVQMIKDQLTLMDVKIDRYDTIIGNIDKEIIPLVDEINVAITSVKTAYDARITAGCKSDLHWEETFRKTYITEFGAFTTIVYKVLKNPSVREDYNYYGAKYYRRPQNQDYGSNIVREFLGTIDSGSNTLTVFGDEGTSELSVGDDIVDNIDNPVIFFHSNLPTIVGFGTTSIAGVTTDFGGFISLGSTIMADVGVGSTIGINIGDSISLSGILTTGTTVVGFGTTTIIVDNVWSPGITTTTQTTIGQTVGIGSTVIWVDSLSDVAIGSSLLITGKLANVFVVGLGNTFVYIGTGSTINTTIGPGIAATFSTFNGFITTSVTTDSLIISIPAVGTGTETFKVGPLVTYPTLIMDAVAISSATNSNFTNIRTTQTDSTTFDYSNNPIDPVTVGILNSNTVSLGHKVVRVNDGSPIGPFQWQEVMTAEFAGKSDSQLNESEQYLRETYPEPPCGASFARYYPGNNEWPVKSTFTYGIGGYPAISTSFSYANEGDTVVSFGLTSLFGIGYVNVSSINPSAGVCNALTAAITAAEASRDAIIARNLPKIDSLIVASNPLREMRNTMESRAFAMLQGRVYGDVEVNKLKQNLSILKSTDYTPFEPPTYYFDATTGKLVSSKVGEPIFLTSIVSSGLVLNLDAGNPQSYSGSGTTWTDLSGNGNNGTLVNGVAYSGGNNSLVFDGVNDFVINSSTTNIPVGSSSRTIQFWVYPKADTNNFIQLGTGGGGNQVYIVEFYNIIGTRYLFTDGINVGNNLTISGSQLPTLNTWNHITFGNSGQNWFYYLNGALQTSGTFSVTLNTIGQKYIVGKRDDSPANTMNANMAQVSIYNRALTASEISQNFNALRGRFGL